MKSDLNSQTTPTPDIAPSRDFAQVDRVNSATKLAPCRVSLSSFWIMVVETSGPRQHQLDQPRQFELDASLHLLPGCHTARHRGVL